ncbi:MAG: hypothetical protein R3B06_11075 [Kofleriaceae bacterium]
MSGRAGGAAVGLGVAVAAAHLALLPAWIAATARPSLAVTWPTGLAAETPGTGTVAAGVAAEVTRDGDGPGLVTTRFTAHYRGGVTRTATAATLVGPFQDPAAPPCSGRLVVSQRLLDRADDGSVIAVLRRELHATLDGTEVFGLGRFRSVDDVSLRWTGLADRPAEAGMFPRQAVRAPTPGGYLRAQATVAFDRLKLVVVVGALPRTDGGELGFTVGVRAHLAVDNRALAWLVDRLGVDRLATRLARGQLDRALVSTLGPPPPLVLPDGQTLTIALCRDRPVAVVDGAYAALPLAWQLGPAVPTADGVAIRPPARGPVAWPPPDADADLTIDLDLDGVNGLLYELWRTGQLDRQLDRLALADRFNQHPTVAGFLSLRLAAPRLALPPVVAPAPPDHLRLGVVAALTITDGDRATPATAIGSAEIGLAGGDAIAAAVAITGLDATCAPAPHRLEPCYGVVFDAIRDATGDTHAALGAALSTTLTELFVARRVEAAQAPAALIIDRARAAVIADGGAVRLALAAHLAPPAD